MGAVVVFLALAVIGLTSQDDQTVRSAYLVMEPAAWFVLVPVAFASLLTGIVMSLGTVWGVFAITGWCSSSRYPSLPRSSC
jgi:ABC-type anion transport system duplicated permease subunit